MVCLSMYLVHFLLIVNQARHLSMYLVHFLLIVGQGDGVSFYVPCALPTYSEPR